MKYIDFIKYLINPERLRSFYEDTGANIDSEALLIYMKGSITLESEIAILGIEETDDDLAFEIEGTKYYQLFSVDHAINLIEFDLGLKNKGYSDEEIAQRLLDYRQKDA